MYGNIRWGNDRSRLQTPDVVLYIHTHAAAGRARMVWDRADSINFKQITPCGLHNWTSSSSYRFHIAIGVLTPSLHNLSLGQSAICPSPFLLFFTSLPQECMRDRQSNISTKCLGDQESQSLQKIVPYKVTIYRGTKAFKSVVRVDQGQVKRREGLRVSKLGLVQSLDRNF